MNRFDSEIKQLFKERDLRAPEHIKLRIDQTLSNLPEPGNKVFKRKSKWRKIGLVGTLVALLGIFSTATFADLSNTGIHIQDVQSEHPYVVLHGNNYKATGEMIEQEKLGNKLAEVKRIGGWSIKRDGDSAFFLPGDSIYEIKGADPNIKVAIKTVTGGTKLFPEYKFFILKRSEQVNNPKPQTIVAAKNDPEEVSYAMENIRRLDKHLYEFKNMESHASIAGADYHPVLKIGMKNGTNIYYTVPEVGYIDHDIKLLGYISVQEYSKSIKQYMVSRLNPEFNPYFNDYKVQKEFDMNGLHWKYYGDHLYIGEKDGYLYEIWFEQGKFDEAKMMEFIRHFQHA
jgi:hypothetical protein